MSPKRNCYINVCHVSDGSESDVMWSLFSVF